MLSYHSTSLQIPPLDRFKFPELAPISTEQVDFTICQFKTCITQLVHSTPLPFIHPSSYQTTVPQEYQDLLGVSAMYLQKNAENQQTIFAMLDRSVSRLLLGASSWTVEELLLATQALVVYQIIRLFDGDVRQRANAERHLLVLHAWTNRLREETNSAGPCLLVKPTYERWVMIESARRTVLISVMLQAIYSLTKDGVCDSVPMMATLPVSLDGRLWKMSEDEWWSATSGNEIEPVTYREYVSKWAHGDPLRIEAYETILLVACKHNAKRISYPPMEEDI